MQLGVLPKKGQIPSKLSGALWRDIRIARKRHKVVRSLLSNEIVKGMKSDLVDIFVEVVDA